MAKLQVKGPELKKLIGLGKRGAMPFAFNPANKDADHAMFVHRSKAEEALARAAKDEGLGKKVAFGTFSVEGSKIILQCTRDLPGLAKTMQKYLKSEGISFEVALSDGAKPVEQAAADSAPDKDRTDASAKLPTKEKEPKSQHPSQEPEAAKAEQTDLETTDENVEEDGVELGSIANPETAALYLDKMAKQLRKRQMNFGLVMPSAEPTDIRILFHRTKKGKALAGALSKELKSRKFTFGIAAMKETVEDLNGEAVPVRTLLLAVEGRLMPGLAKRMKQMFHGLGVSGFRKVVIAQNGKQVEVDGDTPPPDGSAQRAASKTAASEAGRPEALDFDKTRDNLLKALDGVFIPVNAPPDQIKSLKIAVERLRKTLNSGKAEANLETIIQVFQIVMARSAGLVGQYPGAIDDLDDAAEVQRVKEAAADLSHVFDGLLVSVVTPAAEVRRLGQIVGLLRNRFVAARTQQEFEELAAAIAPVVSKAMALHALSPASPIPLDDAIRIQSQWDTLPKRLHDFFRHPKNEMGVGYHVMPSFCKVAEKVRGLSEDDLSGFWRWMHIPAKNMRTLNAGIDAYLGTLKTRASVGDKVFQQGKNSGKTLANHGDGDPIVAGERIARDFPTMEDAATFARGLDTAAAVVVENNRFVIYKVSVKNSEWLSAAADSLTIDDNQTTETDSEKAKELSARERELLVAKLKVYGEYADFAVKFGNPLLWPLAAVDAATNLLQDKPITGVTQEDLDEIAKLEFSVATLRSDLASATALSGSSSNLAAIITEDDYVLRSDGKGGATIDRSGGTSDPYIAHMKAFGPGLERCKTREEFEKQFELVMRDAAYDAVGKAEKATKDLQKRLADSKLSDADQAALERTLKLVKPVQEKLDVKERELLIAKLKLYGEYAEFAGKYGNPMTAPFAVIEVGWNLLNDRSALGVDPKIQAEVDRLQREVNDLKAKRSAAAAEFPLALRIENRDAFGKLPPEEQAKMLRGEVDQMFKDIQDTRDNIDEGDFDLWTMPTVCDTAMKSLKLTGDQLSWAKEKADWEKKKDTALAVGEVVVGVGLAAGAIVFSGGTATGVVIAGASVAVGGYGAYNATEEYLRKGAAANIDADPSKGLVPPEDVPHWGWVAAAWVGAGFDAASVGAAIKAFRTTKDLAKAAKILGVPPDRIDDVLRPALTGRKISKFNVTEYSPEEYRKLYGNELVEATTKIERVGGGYHVEVFLRPGADPLLREAAVLEEMRHLKQLGNDEFAKHAELLTEKALANWPTKTPVEKMQAKLSQLVMEENAQRSLIAKLHNDLLKARDIDQIDDLMWQISSAQRSKQRYANGIAEIEKALPTEVPPKSVDLTFPPRLHNTAEESVSFQEAMKLPGLKAQWEALPDKELYIFYKRAGKIDLRRRPGVKAELKKVGKELDPKRVIHDETTGTWKIVDQSEVDKLARQRDVEIVGSGENEVIFLARNGDKTDETHAILRKYHKYAERSADELDTQLKVGQKGVPADEGGHKVGHRFDLEHGEENMFPQDANFNKGAYKKMENEFTAWIDADCEVHFSAELSKFDGDRPQRVLVRYAIYDKKTGKKVHNFEKLFKNDNSQTFNRLYPDDIDALIKKATGGGN